MTSVEAIYEGGLFRPLQTLHLPDKAHVRISVETMVEDPVRAAWLAESERGLLKTWENDDDDVSTRCSRNDVVLLPIPFTDLSSHKVLPAIVIGFGTFPCDLFLVPLTSRVANADFPLADWQIAGLNAPGAVKAQLATVESRLVRKIVGCISDRDQLTLDSHLRVWLSL